jgi:hypothetical protein
VEKRKANDEPTNPETPRNKDLKYDGEKRTRTFQNSWIDKFPWVVFDENAQEMYCKLTSFKLFIKFGQGDFSIAMKQSYG